MTDVIFLSSLFAQIKIAEPMGASILAAGLRERGFTVEILEPSVHGLTIDEVIAHIADSGTAIVALSMLRDKHVKEVVEFTTKLRAALPGRFVVVGGHGPSISVAGIPHGLHVADYVDGTGPAIPTEMEACSTSLPFLDIQTITNRAIVDPALTDRGKGAADIEPRSAARHSSYFDLTIEYLQILQQIDTYMLGESDAAFPELVGRVLSGESWRDLPGLAFLDEQGRLFKTPLSPKLVNLDLLPFMARDTLVEYRDIYQTDIPASLLASRGCFYRCTFCSVVRYERLQPGINHRQRSNENLIAEISELHRRYGISKFNFEDDNFIVKNKRGIEKIHDLADQILALDFDIEFTFFCRADVVEHGLFKHLTAAGLCGIYFGLESVFEGDLDFFHKGLTVDQMLRAMDALIELGFSPDVEADRRIMLGYITWHPLTSFESLRATSEFVRKYQAPPKLLRRKLRVYAGTEILGDIDRLGLLDGDDPDGWHFLDSRLEGLDVTVNNLFAAVNKRRDMLRTLEKAAHSGSHHLPVAELRQHRRHLDSYLIDSFDRIIEAGRMSPEGAASPQVSETFVGSLAGFERYMADHGVRELIEHGYQECGFPAKAVDLYRK